MQYFGVVVDCYKTRYMETMFQWQNRSTFYDIEISAAQPHFSLQDFP